MNDLSTLHRLAAEVENLNLERETANSCLRALLKFSYGFMVPGAIPHINDIWYRARPCDDVERFDFLSEVLCNKLGKHPLGRCNLPGQQILYAASNIQTSASEVRAKVGDVIQITAIRPVLGSAFHYTVLGSYRDVAANNKMDLHPFVAAELRRQQASSREAFERARFIDEFIAKLYSNETEKKYLLTAALSAYYLSQKAGGISYPSVKFLSGFNLAITSATFDSDFEVVASSVWRIDDALPNGEFRYTSLSFADDYSDDGKILWDQPPKRTLNQGPYNWEVPRTSGWRPTR